MVQLYIRIKLRVNQSSFKVVVTDNGNLCDIYTHNRPITYRVNH